MKSTSTMKIAVTIGDPSGIGPELVLKTIPQFLKYKPVVYGIHQVLKQTAEYLSLSENYKIIKDCVRDVGLPIRFRFGIPNEKTGRIALNSLRSALADNPDILITAPIVKNVIKKFYKNFVGHTEFLADYYQVKNFAMVGLIGKKRIMCLTTHLPVVDVPRHIKKDEVFNKLLLFDWGLKRFFGIKKPALAVSAFNPHGDEFSYGEEHIIKQGIILAGKKGINASGPFPADSIFSRPYDGYLVIYHDQGFIYLKSKKGGLNWTMGLPIIRLSPLYGAALDIAGKGIADTTGMVNAIKMGIEMYKNLKGAGYEN
ncbi:MAG: PdxA family dehydrogenase [bacterium]